MRYALKIWKIARENLRNLKAWRWTREKDWRAFYDVKEKTIRLEIRAQNIKMTHYSKRFER